MRLKSLKMAFCRTGVFLGDPTSTRFRTLNTKRPNRTRYVTPKMLGPRTNSTTIDSKAAEKTAIFESWLQENGMYLSKVAGWGKPKHPMAVANRTTDEGEPSGRGLVAIKSITQGESLFQVPYELIMTKDKALESIPQLPSGTDEYLAIATLLMRERSLGERSFWAPYLDVLPEDEELIPLFRWSEEDMGLLNGSPSLAAAKNLRQKLQREFDDLDKAVFSTNRAVFPEEVYNYARWEWAFAVLFSRAIRLTGDSMVALVPYADLLNHNPFCSTYIDTETTLLTDRKYVTLYTDRPYPKMSQVFVTYGPKPNSDLLLLYGFVIDRNPYDSVDITVSIREDDPLFERKRKYLRESGVDSMDNADFGDFICIDNETQVADALVDACKEAIRTYPQTIEDDEKLIRDRGMYMMLSQKHRWAIRQRLSEKRILQRTMLNIQSEMEDPKLLFTSTGE